MTKEKVINHLINLGIVVVGVLIANKIQEQFNKVSIAPPTAAK